MYQSTSQPTSHPNKQWLIKSTTATVTTTAKTTSWITAYSIQFPFLFRSQFIFLDFSMRSYHAKPSHVFYSFLSVQLWSKLYCLFCHSHYWALLRLFQIVARTCMYINRVQVHHIKPTTINFAAQHPSSPPPPTPLTAVFGLLNCRPSRCLMRCIFILRAHFPFRDHFFLVILLFCSYVHNAVLVTVIYDCPI